MPLEESTTLAMLSGTHECRPALRQCLLSSADQAALLEETYVFPDLMYNAATHSAAGRYDIALSRYQRATDQVNRFLNRDLPLCLILVYQPLGARLRLGHDPNRSAMMRFIASAALVKLSTAHPVAKLIATVSFRDDSATKVAELGLRSGLDMFEVIFGPNHPFTQKLTYRMCNLPTARGSYYSAILQLKRLINAYETSLGRKSYDVCWTMMVLADCYHLYGDLVSAEQVFEKASDRGDTLTGSKQSDVQVRYYRAIMEVMRAQGNHEKAKILIKAGINVSRTAFGVDDHRTVAYFAAFHDLDQY